MAGIVGVGIPGYFHVRESCQDSNILSLGNRLIDTAFLSIVYIRIVGSVIVYGYHPSGY